MVDVNQVSGALLVSVAWARQLEFRDAGCTSSFPKQCNTRALCSCVRIVATDDVLRSCWRWPRFAILENAAAEIHRRLFGRNGNR